MQKFRSSEITPVVLLIALSLAVGLWTIRDYGESWDEYNFFRYASESLLAYPGLLQPGFKLEFYDPTLRYYGPWFLMSIVLVSRLFPQWYISDIAHLMTFLLFQCGVLLMYLLARRWLKPPASFGAALLFATQPLLWGHAFINARDVPFMVGFLASVYFGLKMVDTLPVAQLGEEKQKTNSTVLMRQDAQALRPLYKVFLPLLALIGIIGFAWLTLWLMAGWRLRAPSLADTSSVHELDLYLRPLLIDFWGAAIFISLTLLWLGLLYLPLMPRLRSYLWEVELRPYARLLSGWLRNRNFLIATLVLGLTVGIRIMGLAAAGLVGLFLFIKQGRAAFFLILVHVLLAMIVVYILWPYIWSEPFLRLLIVLRIMLRFPWPGTVLFDGAYYAGNELPRSYLPTLLGLQLTEPLLVLALIGFGIVIWQAAHRKSNGGLFLLIGLWFGLPLAAAALGRPYLYDNFRQFLFILPALFLLAGFGLENIIERIRWQAARLALLAAVVAPGLYAMAVLHPYEYIYYNSLAGGVTGAFRRFEMDYWGTSFREVAGYLNAGAPRDSKVVVWGPNTALWRYLRPDIKVYDYREDDVPADGFYAVFSTRNDNDLLFYADRPALYTVQRQGAVLAVVKYVGP